MVCRFSFFPAGGGECLKCMLPSFLLAVEHSLSCLTLFSFEYFAVTHTAFDVESVAAVCHRIRNVVTELEEAYENAHIVLVSHADTLQIAKLYAAQAENVGLFSSYRFQNGEVRPMIVGSTDHFPDPVSLEKPKRDTAEVLKDLKVSLE